MVCLAVGSTAGAVQDARALPSTGFRPPFGLGRVTLERPKVTKGLLPRQSAGFASTLGSESTSDGTPQTAHPCADCGYAIIPDGVPDVAPAPRRIGGGSIPCPTLAWVLHLKFGEGITLNFDGAKWLVTAYARLEAL
ncbi:hypothetical protein CF134_00745 [Aeromonas salmonicida]|nr:hypothetical protein K931_05341 [Aeromonas salmonicida subsp. pectinolytica 34mel]TNI24088.1 hypothetical protein CF134_00745 [Aeromonas salmonicida]